jgi:hypothetical protein
MIDIFMTGCRIIFGFFVGVLVGILSTLFDYNSPASWIGGITSLCLFTLFGPIFIGACALAITLTLDTAIRVMLNRSNKITRSQAEKNVRNDLNDFKQAYDHTDELTTALARSVNYGMVITNSFQTEFEKIYSERALANAVIFSNHFKIIKDQDENDKNYIHDNIYIMQI